MKRFFLVSYNATVVNKVGAHAWGSISFANYDFFSKSFVIDSIKEKFSYIDNICIMNIYEFKDELDYEKYNEENID